MHVAFGQIRQLGYKRSQFGLTGTIINVPYDVRHVQQALPRDCNDSMTVAVLLKRKLEYKNAYLLGNIRAIIVMHELYELCKTPFYIQESIVIDQQ